MIADAWLIGPTSSEEVDTFLEKYKPSAATQEHGPWYWVQVPRGGKHGETQKPAEEAGDEDKDRTSFEKEGASLVEQLTEQCAWIKENAPIRGKKKEGIKSQKELREAEHAKFNEEVAKLAKKHKVLSGKWLFYPSPENVDFQWSKIVKAIALEDGALAKTGAVHTAKVSTAPGGGGGDQHVICVYCDDSWDRDGVSKAFKALVEELSMVSSAYKADANTILGIDSKHPSGIRSSLYGKTEFMTKEEIEAALAQTSKAKEVKKKSLEQELEGGGGEGFDPVSDDSEDERPKKVQKKAKK